MNRNFLAVFLLVLAPFAFSAQCSLSAFPTSLETGSSSLVTVSYSGRSILSDGIIINCGNGHSVAAGSCFAVSGSCSGSCYYPVAGQFSTQASIEGTACQAATVTASNPSPDCGDLICSPGLGESPQTCPLDCGVLKWCGDGICSYGESQLTCPADCGGAVDTCADGTRFSTCSESQPLYCNNGILVDRASLCACPAGKVIKGDTCAEPACVDGTAKNTCSFQKPFYCTSDAKLVEKSSLCGCPLGLIPSNDACVGPGSCNLVSTYAVDTIRNVSKGADAHYVFSVTNAAPTGQEVHLSVLLPDGADASFSNSSATLAVNQTLRPELVINTANLKPGTYQLDVIVAAFSCKKTVPVTLTVYESADIPSCCSVQSSINATLSAGGSTLVRPGGFAGYSLYLQNGATGSNAIASLSSPSSPFPVSFSRNGFELGPGEATAVEVKVQVPLGTPGNQFSIPVIVKYATNCCIREFPVTASLSVYGPRVAATLLREPAPECIIINQTESSGRRISFGLRNDGDERSTFRLVVSENPPLYGNVRASQPSIDINPGQSGFFDLFISPSGLGPNYTYTYSFSALYGSYNALNRNYCFSVASQASPTPAAPPGAYGLPLLVDSPAFDIVSGVAKTYALRISNPGPAMFPNLTIVLDGVPSTWYFVDGPKSALEPYSTRTYYVDFLARRDQYQPSYRYVTVLFKSNGALVGKANTTLELSEPRHDLDYSYVVNPVVVNANEVASLQVTLTVVNRGNVAEKNITAQVPVDSGVAYSSSPESLDLSPGESGVISLMFWPSSDSSQSQSLPVRIASDGGVGASKVITVPAMTGLAVLGKPNFPWWFYGILGTVFLVLAMLLIARHNEPGRMG